MGEEEENRTVQALPEMITENVEALLEAARYDDMDDVVSLASSGVPLDSKDEQGRTALHMAAANGHIEIVEYLIGQGVVVKKLIMAGANVGVLNSHERTPMDEAYTRGKLEVMDAINEAAALVELRNAMVSTQEPSS